MSGASTDVLERVTFEADGASSAEPVRIYVGTEPPHWRALRVLLWSIEQTRSRDRGFDVYVMSGLAGFRRARPSRGAASSPYRFAVPHHAGGSGRAIYCDVTHVFRADPAELFTTELGAAGYLATSDVDTSVMLIDCARLADVWTLAAAERSSAQALCARAARAGAGRGELAASWSAGNGSAGPARRKLLHFAMPHTYPWCPFPGRFAYRPHPDADIWLDLERQAVAAGFTGFTAERPTRAFAALCEPAPAAGPSTAEPVGFVAGAVREIVVDGSSGSVLELRAEPAGPGSLLGFLQARAGASDPSQAGPGAGADEAATADTVVCTAPLDDLPPEDVAWAVEALFRAAKRTVVVVARCWPSRKRTGPGGTLLTEDWWVAQLEEAATRHPGIRWHLRLLRAGERPDAGPWLRQGGPVPAGTSPRVWVLTDDRPGNSTQSLGLAEAAGLDFEQVELDFGLACYVPNPIAGATDAVLTRASRRKLAPPWPDLVIAAGRRTAPVARCIAERSRGRTRTVLLGRKGANPAHAFDLAISSVHCGLHPHPNRIETAGTVTRVRAARLAEAAVQWKGLFDAAPAPHVVLLVGGGSNDYALSAEIARNIARDVLALVEREGGSLYVSTSRRTGAHVSDALETAARASGAYFHRFTPDRAIAENPYMGLLALADVLVVTGETESMLAEASASGHPVEIYELPPRDPGRFIRLVKGWIDRIVAWSEPAPGHPQRGRTLLCARLVEGGWIRPNRNLPALHDAMIARGVAARFDGALHARAAVRETDDALLVARVRALAGLPVAEEPDA